MNKEFQELPTIPGWLEQPPIGLLDPPVVGNAQELPFDKLDWSDFEKLCLRLVRAEVDIELCRIYGVQGDEQEGIDLLARGRDDDLFRVYQCKRVKEFGPAKIQTAVEKFLNGSWKSRADRFYLCTMESLRSQARTEEVLKQIEALRKENIALVPWDLEELSLLLKDKPSIVLDFFGRAWVERFNGPHALTALARRLDRNQIARLRERLAKFYFSLFTVHDPTFQFSDPIRDEDGRAIVLPDVLQIRQTTPTPSAQPDAAMGTDERGLNAERRQRSTPAAQRFDETRSLAQTWLSQGKLLLLTGGPGSGKSTLLRTITLDLLSRRPQFGEIAAAWGTYLPIWVPFARWTTLLAAHNAGTVSLLNLLKDWFALHDAEELFPLIVEALDDERLLLLVDGLDEWHTPDAGRNAITLLETFIRRRNLPAIACARPHAVDILGTIQWQRGRLAALSDEQQERIILDILIQEHSATIAEGMIRSAARECLQELHSRSDLMAVARSPMILVLLVQLWYLESDLPSNRFAAFRRMVEVLIATQPERRRRAAVVQHDGLPTPQLLQVFCYLALHILEEHPSGVVPCATAARVIEAFLIDDEHGWALPLAIARRQAEELVSYATDSAGLLVRHSVSELAFLHRALLERLAAEALTSLTGRERRDFVLRHACNPQMSEVIIALTSIVTSREDVQMILDTIKEAMAGNAYEKLRGLPLSYEIALTAPACPPRAAKEITEQALHAIETSPYLALRQTLTELSVRGLRVGPTQQMIQEHIARWFPRRPQYRRPFYQTIATWPSRVDAESLLLRGLYEDEVADVRAAAESLTILSAGDAQMAERIVALAEVSPNFTVRAALLDALLRHAPQDILGRVETIVGKAPKLELRLMAIHSRIVSGEILENDKEWLLLYSNWTPSLDSEWRRLIPEFLSRGWPEDTQVRDRCLRALQQVGVMDRELAVATLARTRAGDPDVALLIARHLERHSTYSADEIWPYLVDARPHMDGVNQIMSQLLYKKFDVVAAHWAGLVLRDEEAKRVLIERLRRDWPGWIARALLRGWGMGDADVREALTELAMENSPAGGAVAHLLPDIIPDRVKCRARLLESLECLPRRIDFIVQGLAAIRSPSPEPEIPMAIRKALSRAEAGFVREDAKASLIANWCDDPEVEKIAVEECDAPRWGMSALAAAGKMSGAVRAALLRCTGALPAWLRLIVARELGSSNQDYASTVLARYVQEPDGEVRSQSVVSWCRHVARQGGSARERALERFHQELAALGPGMDETRTAAFCGIVSLEDVDVFVGMTEMVQTKSSEPAKPVALRIDALRTNRIYLQAIASHWELLRAKLGDEVLPRVLGREAEGMTQWDTLASVAEPRSALGNEIIEKVVGSAIVPMGRGILQFLQQDGRAHGRLRELCLATLGTGADDPDTFEAALTAALIIGESFGGDEELAGRLRAMVDSGDDASYAIVAICEGWPRSEVLVRALEEVEAGKLSVRGYVRSLLLATAGDARAMLEEARSGFRYAVRPAEAHLAIRFIVRRLRVDDAAHEMAVASLDGTNREEWVRLARLLCSARPLGDALRQCARAIINIELEGEAPLMLIDPILLEVRTAGAILMDMLW